MLNTKEEIIDYRKECETKYYKNFIDQIDTQWNYYNGNIEWRLPDNVEKHIPPTAASVVDAAVDKIIAMRFKFTSPSYRDNPTSNTKAQRRSDLVSRVFDFNDRLQEVSLYRDILKHLILYGTAVFKGPLYIEEMWGEEPERKGGESKDDFEERYAKWEMRKKLLCPLRILPAEPSTVFLEPAPEPRFCVEAYSMKMITIKSIYPHWVPPAPYKDWDDVDYVTYWDEEKRCCLIVTDPKGTSGRNSYITVPMLSEDDQKRISEKTQAYKDWDWANGFIPNVYGYLPYTRIYSGLGTSTSRGLPEERSVGMLLRCLSALKNEARLETAIASQVETNAWRPYNIFYPEDVDPKDLKVEYGAGIANKFRNDIKVEPMQPNPMTSDIYQMLSIAKGEIEMGTISRSGMGMKTPGVYSGYHEQTIIAQTLANLRAFINPFVLGLSKVSSKILMAVDGLTGKLYNCTPSDIGGFYEVIVDVDTRTPEEKQVRQQLGMQLLQYLPFEYVAEHYLDLPDPQQAYIKMQKQRMISSGIFDDLILSAVMERDSIEQIRAKVKERLTQTPQTTQGEYLPIMKQETTMPNTSSVYGTSVNPPERNMSYVK